MFEVFIKSYISFSVVVYAKDQHSGIKKVSFKFKINKTEEVRSEHTFDIQTQVINILLVNVKRQVRLIFSLMFNYVI